MQTTDRGLLALVRHEGVVPAPYLDVKRVWTFGIGHTAAAGLPDPARMPRGMPADLDAGLAEAFRLFRADLARYEAEVRRAVTVPLAGHEFDALVSLHYNTGGIARAALTRAQRRRSRSGGRGVHELAPSGHAARPARGRARPLPAWALPRGFDPGLGGRRYGRVDFVRPVRRLGEPEALALLRPPPLVAPAPRPPAAPRSPGLIAALFAALTGAFQRS